MFSVETFSYQVIQTGKLGYVSTETQRLRGEWRGLKIYIEIYPSVLLHFSVFSVETFSY